MATSTAPADDLETTVLGACPHDCPDTCSMLVKVKGGRVTGVQGNPDHPFTRGRLCAKTNHYEERVYHPERLLYPDAPVGSQGLGPVRPHHLGGGARHDRGALEGHHRRVGPTAILPYSYLGHEGLLNGLTVGDPFFNKLGATVSERTFCDSGACTAYIMTLGPTPGMDPESLAHSKYIVLWACNMLSTNAHLWPFVAEAQAQRRQGRGDRSRSRRKSAQMADWHIQVRPGTDTALALALMHVIIRDGLVDRAYVADHTVGFDELAEHVKPNTPAWAEAQTGIPAADIERLAREYAQHQPSAIRIGVGIERSAGGGQLVRALSCLPALVGAWRKPGGGILQLPLWAFPMNWAGLQRADFLPPGTRVLNQWELGRALTGALPPRPADPVAVRLQQQSADRGTGPGAHA